MERERKRERERGREGGRERECVYVYEITRTSFR